MKLAETPPHLTSFTCGASNSFIQHKKALQYILNEQYYIVYIFIAGKNEIHLFRLFHIELAGMLT